VAAALVAWLLAVPAAAAALIGLATWAVRAAAAVRDRPGRDRPVIGTAANPGGSGIGATAGPTNAAGGHALKAGDQGGSRRGAGTGTGGSGAGWRAALDRCLASVLARVQVARGRVEQVVDYPVARLTPGRHDRGRIHLRGGRTAEDPSPPGGIVDEVREPATAALGLAAAGGAALAGLPAVVAACIGAATVLIRAALGALEQRADPPGQRPASPIDQGSIEAQWLDRARRATATFADVALGVTFAPLAEQTAMMRLQITETIGVLEGLAVRSSAARRVLERTDVQALATEAERLRAEHAWASGTVATLLGHSLAVVEARMDLHRQLQSARAGILARLELGVAQLEHLAARMTKLALGSALGSAPAPAELDEMVDHLAALRPGLLAAADDARRAHEPGAAAAAG
jgi:hypothetical protein